MKFTKTEIWCYSYDTENFYCCESPCNTKQEAINECISHDAQYIGKMYEIDFSWEDIPDVTDEIAEGLYEQLHDAVGEIAEDYIISTEQQSKLANLLNGVILKFINDNNLQPNCYAVQEIEYVGE